MNPPVSFKGWEKPFCSQRKILFLESIEGCRSHPLCLWSCSWCCLLHNWGNMEVGGVILNWPIVFCLSVSSPSVGSSITWVWKISRVTQWTPRKGFYCEHKYIILDLQINHVSVSVYMYDSSVYSQSGLNVYIVVFLYISSIWSYSGHTNWSYHIFVSGAVLSGAFGWSCDKVPGEE